MGDARINRIFVILSFLFLINFASSLELNGTVYDISGNALFNATVNVTIRDSSFSVVGYNATQSNQTGWFNLTVTNSAAWFYQIDITHFQQNKTDGTTTIDYIGQSLPSFPYQELQNGLSTNFYLRDGGTLNISAVNATGSPIAFQYMVKDQSLGYPISMGFTSYVTNKVVYVPRDRNYSIQIFPNQSMPVSYNWNNFSTSTSYNITAGLSTYNATTYVLNKTFNVSTNLIRVNGYINDTAGSINGWNEFTVVPFILESGNMVFLGDNAAMPYNMSAWVRNCGAGTDPCSDNYSLPLGFYNITLPGPAESSNYLLFATGRNATGYYGGYRNMTLNFSSAATQINFTMYPLMSTNWAAANNNITMNDATNWNQRNISSARQAFNLVNSTGALSGLSAHVEVSLDYSSYNATNFTFMTSISQSGSSSFYVPLINSTGIKEINIYSQMYAPKRLGTMTAAQIIANNNITLSQFTPGDVDGGDISSNLKIALFKSNTTCDVPNPSSACVIGSNDPSSGQNFDDFNPLQSIIGGGKLSFRMGLLSSGIIVHYVNVDMMASGPPDALFDDSTSESTSGDFSSAMRFGSNGPTIYDYVLISMPYTEGSSSQSGLSETGDVNISIPLFYSENASGSIDWNTPAWNVSSNGTNATLFAGNHSHYSARSSEWQTLMNNNTCVTDVSTFNATNPCYINKTSNRIWIRLPHFSGTRPSISGTAVTATASSSSSSGGDSNSKGASVVTQQKTHLFSEINPGKSAVVKNFDSGIGVKEIEINVNSKAINVNVNVKKYDGKPAEVKIEKTGNVFQYLQINVDSVLGKLDSAKITFKVDKSWILEKKIDKEDILISKYDENENKWNELETSFNSEDENYYYYETSVSSFSYFAIGDKTVLEEKENTLTDENTNEVKNNTIVWVVAVLIVLIVLSAVSRKVKNKGRR